MKCKKTIQTCGFLLFKFNLKMCFSLLLLYSKVITGAYALLGKAVFSEPTHPSLMSQFSCYFLKRFILRFSFNLGPSVIIPSKYPSNSFRLLSYSVYWFVLRGQGRCVICAPHSETCTSRV